MKQNLQAGLNLILSKINNNKMIVKYILLYILLYYIMHKLNLYSSLINCMDSEYGNEVRTEENKDGVILNKEEKEDLKRELDAGITGIQGMIGAVGSAGVATGISTGNVNLALGSIVSATGMIMVAETGKKVLGNYVDSLPENEAISLDRPISPSYLDDNNIYNRNTNNNINTENNINNIEIENDINIELSNVDINGLDINILKDYLISKLGLDMSLIEHSLILGIIFLILGIVIFIYIYKSNKIINRKIEEKINNKENKNGLNLILGIEKKRRKLVENISLFMIILNSIFILIAIIILIFNVDWDNIKLIFKNK